MKKPRIPAFILEFWTIPRDTWIHIREARLMLYASSLAYTSILSLVPMLAVSFAIFQAFGGMNKMYGLIEPIILSNLAEGASEEVIAKLHDFITNAHGAALGVGGLVGLIFTSMSMLSSAEKAINQVWQTPIKKSLFHRVSTYWLFITLGPLALAVAVGAATSAELPLSQLLPGGTGMFLITVGLFLFIYKWVPSTRVHWIPASIAAFFTSILWNLARWGYALYTQKAVSYNKIYGSLGAVPILLLWIYIVWLIVLSGAALSVTLQRRRTLRQKG